MLDPQGDRVSEKELAAALGLTRRKVRKLAETGVLRRFSDDRFDLEEALFFMGLYERRADRSALAQAERDHFHARAAELVEKYKAECVRITEMPGSYEAKLAAADAAGEMLGDLIAGLDLTVAMQPFGAERAQLRDFNLTVKAGLTLMLAAATAGDPNSGAAKAISEV